MILTVTMNPSVDISYPLPQLHLDDVNRVAAAKKEAGGKGLNVSRVIRQAGEAVLATGVIGGIVGQDIVRRLNNAEIASDFYPIAGESRNCIAILHQGCQTEILEPGPELSRDEQQGFLRHVEALIGRAGAIAVSGSLPVGVAADYYRRIIQLAARQGKSVLLDCAGESLAAALDGEDVPRLIKPNKQEIEQLTGRELDGRDIASFMALVDGHRGLRRIPWLVVSLGKYGAFARIDGRYYTAAIPEINAVNAVGSGDATLAGLAIAVNHQQSPQEALIKAMTFGMLNALEPQTGCINPANYSRLAQQVIIHACR